MSKNNVLFSKFFAQLRKITGSSENQHLVAISQEMERIDVALQDLASEVVYCQKYVTGEQILTKVRKHGRLKNVLLNKVLIVQTHFKGVSAVKKYFLWRDYRQKTYKYKKVFCANPYFQYYDSYELIDFSEDNYL